MTDDEYNEEFEKATAMIYNLGMRLFRNNGDDAGDFTQDVYLKAHAKRGSFSGLSKFSTWLYTFALREGLQQIKKQKRLSEDPTMEMEKIASQYETPLEVLLNEETVNLIQSELQELPEMYRLPLILTYYDKMTYEEISKLTEVPVGTLKSNVHRGKQILRQKLADKGFT